MVSSAVKKYAALCMVCLCSSLFFLGLYQFNNKYSQNTIQAANGILALSEEELQKSPVRFLVSGWAIFIKDGEQVKVSVSVKYLDQRTKATQISQFDLVLKKTGGNWKVVG